MNIFKLTNLLLFALLCLIWGSSYILIKMGLYGSDGRATLSPYQVAAIRICAAGLSLLPVAIPKFKKYELKTWAYLTASGMLVMFIPAFLFCIAETRLDSALAAILNVLTPVFVILLNYLLYRIQINLRQMAGIVISFLGVVLLLGLHENINLGSIAYAGYAILATASYAVNALLVKHKLSAIPPLTIASLSFVPLIIPGIVILFLTGYFNVAIKEEAYRNSTAAACVLGVICSTVAWTSFYQLLKRTSARFASSVSFIVPIVALAWGWHHGENMNLIQGVCIFLVLSGIHMTNSELKLSLKYKTGDSQLTEKTFMD